MDKREGAAEKEEEGGILVNNPRAINVAEFASARAVELKTMAEAMMTMGKTHRTFQTLPRHMRRRAMSHDLRRLPKRLRDSEERTMQKCMHKKKSAQGKEGGADEDAPLTKRSRRHRRRPGNLKQEYQRRQAGRAWLETHIWHAKRFKMVEQWGYQLPLHPSDKSVRATYRAMAKHCLLQDVSYLRVIEIVGPQALILRALSHLTSPTTGLTCAAAAFLTGQRHGEVVFYCADRFPEGAIGPVNFLWRAEAPSEEGAMRRLWLWAHPSCAAVLLEELRTATAAENRNSEGNLRVSVRLPAESPLRFRLQGPLAHPVLVHALKTADVQGGAPISQQDRAWWEEYYGDPHSLRIWQEQSSVWTTLGGVRAVTDLPPRCILSLTVRDPRILQPIKRTKTMTESDALAPTDQRPPDVVRHFPRAAPVSPLWERAVREAVNSTKVPTHKLNQMRAELLVPGQQMTLGRRESRIPVILLQQPGNQPGGVGTATASGRTKRGGAVGFGSGWDVVLPSGWGMDFWIALVLRGCRAAGLQACHSCHLQQGVPHFPEGYPDTAAGEAWADKVEEELTKKFKRWPPAKRHNYGKLGVISPFRCPWKKLVEEWREARKVEMEEDEDDVVESDLEETMGETASDVNALSEVQKGVGIPGFFVLRDRSKLETLNDALTANQKAPRIHTSMKGTNQNAPEVGTLQRDVTLVKMDTTVASSGHVDSQAQHSARMESHTGLDAIVADLGQDTGRMLVGVKLSMASRGVPRPFAMICLPSDEDIESFKSNQNHCPVEPIHKEFKLPKRSRKMKKKGKRGPSLDDNPRDIRNAETGKKFQVVPNVNLFDSCHHRVIGFIVDGANTFTTGSGRAVGYCCMLGLLQLLKERPQCPRALVLVRDTKAVQYRFAFVDVIT